MTTKIFTTAALAALLLVSCNSNEPKLEPNDGRVRFVSGIDAPQSRVGGPSGNMWDGNEEIGVYMVEHGQTLSATSIAEGAENVKYTTASVGSMATFTSTSPIYYPMDGSKVDFIAYHPYSEDFSVSFWYDIDIADQSNQSAIDLITASADNNGAGYGKAGATPINLQFTHQFAKVIIKIIKGDGIDDLTGLSVVMKGLHHKGIYDLTDFSLAASGYDRVTTITPVAVGNDTYEAILLPTEFYSLGTDQVVEFTLNGETYTWQISANTSGITELKGGKKYTFDVTITKTRVQATGTINPWAVGGNSTGIAN